jgi:hypothetical protein
MAGRRDYMLWTDPAEDAWLAARLAEGWTVRKMSANWPPQYPRRNVNSINNRKASLGLRVAKEVHTEATPEQTVDVQDQGDSITIRAAGTRIRTLDDLLKHVEADLTVWQAAKPTFRKNEQLVRDHHGKLNLVEYFHVSCTLERKAGPSTQEQVAAMIAAAFKARKPVLTKVPRVVKSDLMQAEIFNDPHLAKLAWPAETGREAWDTGIAVDTVRAGATALMTEGDRRGIAERRFILLGDFFHHDGKGTTTAGTVMDYDSRVQKMLTSGTELLFDLITQSAKSVLTKVYVVPGNHDRVLSWALQLLLQTEFKRHGGVIVDGSYTTTKFMTWGRCLVGMDHGDKGRTRLPAHMAAQCEVEWGNSICREILTGHLHSKASIQTINGITVRTMDSLAPPDLYHAEEKFTASVRSMEAITYHRGGMPAHTDVWSPELHRAPRRAAA